MCWCAISVQILMAHHIHGAPLVKKINFFSKLLMAHHGSGAPLLVELVMAHHSHGAPLVIMFQKNSIFFKIQFLYYFLNLGSLWLNLGSICLISSQIALRGQTSRKVTHPHTTPSQTRLTSEFYPTPATAHFIGTC